MMATQEIHNYTAASGIDASADYLLIDPGSTGSYNKINRNMLLGVSGTPADLSSTQIFTNKTIGNTNPITAKDGSFTLQNTSDTTKQALFSLSGITTGTTRTYTLPNASDTVAGIAATQTLTNKTLTSPTINSPTITNATISADSLSGYTTSNAGTVYGISVSGGTIGSAAYAAGSVGTLALALASVTPSILATGSTRGTVVTSETTASTTYTDLATTTDTVTVTIGSNGIAMVYLYSYISNSTSGANSYVTFAISGATTSGAADNRAIQFQAYTTNAQGSYSLAFLVPGLTAGSTTFKMKYRVDSGTGTFKSRQISVTPL